MQIAAARPSCAKFELSEFPRPAGRRLPVLVLFRARNLMGQNDRKQCHGANGKAQKEHLSCRHHKTLHLNGAFDDTTWPDRP